MKTRKILKWVLVVSLTFNYLILNPSTIFIQNSFGTVSAATHQISAPIERGDRHENVKKLKDLLSVIGYWPFSSNPTNLYGALTEAAIIDFQGDYDLPQTGIVDQRTWDLIEQETKAPLSNPMYRSDVIQVKDMLERLGFGSFVKTDYFGPQTERSVRDFQAHYGLTVNGIVDQNTLALLKELTDTPFQRGQRHKDTIVLKDYLYILGYWGSKNGTTLYGVNTANAVKDFQRDVGLHPSGIAHEDTWAYLIELSDQPLRNPMRRDDAITLKEQLEHLGFGSFSKTDYFGPSTERAVRDFQAYYKLTVDGIAGPRTLDKLSELVNSPFQNGRRHNDTVKIKDQLYVLGLWGSKNGTTLYGSLTEDAIKEFQESAGLPISGIADSTTRARLEQLATAPLKNPMYRDDAIELKENLELLGFGSFAKTDYFGPQTETTLKGFQSHYGLSETGVVNQATLDQINALLDSPFRYTKEQRRHNQTVVIKEHLAVLGLWDPASMTPLYDAQTEVAVKAFQDQYDLPVSGIVDPITRELLTKEATGPLKNPMYRDDVVELKDNLQKMGFGSFVNTNFFGPQTEDAIRELQAYYGLRVTGVVDANTKALIKNLMNSPYHEGKQHNDVLRLKERLARLGFIESTDFTRVYDLETIEAVEAFQFHFDLRINGIADSVTLAKINSILNSPFQRDKRHPDLVEYKVMLDKVGKGGLDRSTLYGRVTEIRVREFQEMMGLPVSGILDEVTIEVLILADQGIKYTNYNVTLDQAIDIQMKSSARPQTDMRYAYVSADYIDENNRVDVETSLNVRSGPSSSRNRVGSLPGGTIVRVISEVNGWYQIEFSGAGWVDAARADVAHYLDPTNFENDQRQRFQFLDLSRSSDAGASLLNAYLNGKGVLHNHGATFIEAGRRHGVNEVYLLSHALLETAHGFSSLANGVEVGKDDKGALQLVTSSNRSNLTDIKKTYNMYGIGAVDNNAHQGGAFRAYNEGWFTPELGIIGGARFISNNYLQRGQNTLYKMRWNPDAMSSRGVATHQYATDIGWASKQVTSIYNLYRDLNITHIYLDIPQYLK